jgi:iron-sulfur cluster assembly protein
LRIAARRAADGSIEYAVGFDELGESDVKIPASNDVTVIIDGTSVELLDGATVDYVELEPGQFELVFLNPNDPHFVPPKQDRRSKRTSER